MFGDIPHGPPQIPSPKAGSRPAAAPQADPEEAAEIERLIAEIEIEHIRLDAILIEKQAEADERARIKALKREAEAQEARNLAASGANQQPVLPVQSPDCIRDLWS